MASPPAARNPFGISGMPVPIPGPDPNSTLPGVGGPGAVPGVGAVPGGPNPAMASPVQSPTRLQALLKELGPYASVGAMAGGIGGKWGILAAPAVAMALQQLLKTTKSGKGKMSKADRDMIFNTSEAGGMKRGGKVKKYDIGGTVTGSTPPQAQNSYAGTYPGRPGPGRGFIGQAWAAGQQQTPDGTGFGGQQPIMDRIDQAIQNRPQFSQTFPVPPSPGNPPSSAPPVSAPPALMKKGGFIIPKDPNQKGIKTMRKEFRSNGPKVADLKVSPRKAMGMGIISPTAIPVKQGGRIGKVKDTDKDGMKCGGGVKKYAKGGEIKGWGMARGSGPSHCE